VTLLSRVSVFFLLISFIAWADSSSAPPEVSGRWQVSWEGRLGTEHDVLELQQAGEKLTGTFKDVHGRSTLSGNIGENGISLDVHFQGSRPYTIRFTGRLDGGTIRGVSDAIGIGSTGPYLGHGGEIAQPQHPWTAVRVTP
jgi:hypothetical protein